MKKIHITIAGLQYVGVGEDYNNLVENYGFDGNPLLQFLSQETLGEVAIEDGDFIIDLEKGYKAKVNISTKTE